jgi:hypothetical protein
LKLLCRDRRLVRLVVDDERGARLELLAGRGQPRLELAQDRCVLLDDEEQVLVFRGEARQALGATAYRGVHERLREVGRR